MESLVTYTFSRALHLMRYSGAKMRHISWECDYIYILDGVMYSHIVSHYGTKYETSIEVPCDYIHADDIMGSWVEVK